MEFSSFWGKNWAFGSGFFWEVGKCGSKMVICQFPEEVSLLNIWEIDLPFDGLGFLLILRDN